MSPDAMTKAAHITQRIHNVMAEELTTDDPESDDIAAYALAVVVAGFIVCGDAEPDLKRWQELMSRFVSLTIDFMPDVHAGMVAPMFKDQRQ